VPYATDSRNASASSSMAPASAVGMIGVTVQRIHEVHGAVKPINGAALSASTIATPPRLSVKL
jgi:hypothetical protein